MSIFKKENGTLVEYTNPIANNCIAPVEDGGTSAHAYAEGAFVMVRNILKKITSAVSIGDAIDNTNSQDTTVATELADIEGEIEQINTDLSDCGKRTLLWSNPDPTQSFPSGNITLSKAIENFDDYEIYYQLSTSGGVSKCARGSINVGINLNITQEYIFYRNTGVPNGTSLGFGSGATVTSYGNSNVANTWIIPLKVYGIKY